MKHLLIFIFIILLIFSPMHAQKINIGISFNSMWDRNWNIPLKDFMRSQEMNLYSVFPVNYGVVAEKKYSRFSPSIGLNVVQRKLNTYDYTTTPNSFWHYTVEIPFHINYHKQIKNETFFIGSLGTSVNHVLTKTNKASYSSDHPISFFQFNLLNPNQINWALNGGIGIENNFGNAGILQIKFQFVYQVKALLQYRYIDPSYNFVQYSNTFRANYTMVGLTYYPPFFYLKKE